MSEESLVLPPLQPPKDYVPEFSSGSQSPAWSSRGKRRLKAPLPSQLQGAADALFEQSPKAPIMILEDSAQAVAQRRLVLVRQRDERIEEDRQLSLQTPVARSG